MSLFGGSARERWQQALRELVAARARWNEVRRSRSAIEADVVRLRAEVKAMRRAEADRARSLIPTTVPAELLHPEDPPHVN